MVISVAGRDTRYWSGPASTMIAHDVLDHLAEAVPGDGLQIYGVLDHVRELASASGQTVVISTRVLLFLAGRDQWGAAQGDVARRLELQKHGHPASLSRGRQPGVSAALPEVQLLGAEVSLPGSTGIRAGTPGSTGRGTIIAIPYWDPRPIWCRPVIYDPCPLWVYWQTPVWTPLAGGRVRHVGRREAGRGCRPSSPTCNCWRCGLSIRAIPRRSSGPRYRVWFRNNGDQADHAAVQRDAVCRQRRAARGRTCRRPACGSRRSRPATSQSVDVRLPVEVYAMGRDAAGQPGAVWHAARAGRRQPRSAGDDQGQQRRPACAGRHSAGRSGGVRRRARRGPAGRRSDRGRRRFRPRSRAGCWCIVGGQEMEAEILGWYDLGVRLTLPKMPLAGPTRGRSDRRPRRRRGRQSGEDHGRALNEPA